LPERFKGLPEIDGAACSGEKCLKCAEACPTGALKYGNSLTLDTGLCIFCGKCEELCPEKAVKFTGNWRLAANSRQALVLPREGEKIRALDNKMLSLFGRSLKLRQVSAGGCGACEADTNVLSTVVFDLGRFGVQFVASPRHAGGLLVTGPVTLNMASALKDTYAAVAEPKIVIAAGACAISGGIYSGSKETLSGADKILPVDLYIPGCPPHPCTILDGLLTLLGKIKAG